MPDWTEKFTATQVSSAVPRTTHESKLAEAIDKFLKEKSWTGEDLKNVYDVSCWSGEADATWGEFIASKGGKKYPLKMMSTHIRRVLLSTILKNFHTSADTVIGRISRHTVLSSHK